MSQTARAFIAECRKAMGSNRRRVARSKSKTHRHPTTTSMPDFAEEPAGDDEEDRAR